MNNLGFDGVFAFPPTPMDDAGEYIELGAYERVLTWLVESGVHAVIAMGSTGEFAYLTTQERQDIADATVKTLNGRLLSIIGISAIATREAVDLAKHAAKVGADAIMLSVPTYYPLTSDQVVRHVGAVARAVEMPLMLYNNPFTSRVDLTVQLLEQLAHIETLVAVKEATTDVNRIPLIQDALGDRIAVLGGGFDPYALPAFCVGARGWTTGMASIVPEHCVALHRAAVLDKDLATAQRLNLELAPLANLLVDTNLTAAVKCGLGLIGRPVGAPRRPLTPLSAKDEMTMRNVLGRLGVM